LALLVYTSGTTGRPKGAMLGFGNILFKTASAVAFGGLQSEDIHLAIPPLYHISGMLFGLNIPLYSGATTVLHYRFDPVATLESIERHKVTYWKGIAPMLGLVNLTPRILGNASDEMPDSEASGELITIAHSAELVALDGEMLSDRSEAGQE
ncbi:hypothetical protein KXX11_003989, partial [Aspergillus fumigatus]